MNIIKKFLNLTYYTSELDRFLFEYDQKHPKLSAAQRAEKEKYDRIYALRDKPSEVRSEEFWDNF